MIFKVYIIEDAEQDIVSIYEYIALSDSIDASLGSGYSKARSQRQALLGKPASGTPQSIHKTNEGRRRVAAFCLHSSHFSEA